MIKNKFIYTIKKFHSVLLLTWIKKLNKQIKKKKKEI